MLSLRNIRPYAPSHFPQDNKSRSSSETNVEKSKPESLSGARGRQLGLVALFPHLDYIST